MMRCPSCHGEVPVASRFCGECGAAIAATETPTQTSVFDGSESGTSAPVPTPSSLGGTIGAGVGRLSQTASTAEPRFLPGVMLAGRYRIIGLLGTGGMGEVYRADDLTLGQPVALKFLPQSLINDPGRLQRFLNEVRVARQVSHANVCRVYDIGEYDGQHFLSMEYIDGENLASLTRRVGRFSTDRAVQMARQICAGLAAAHAKGIVHRDLKPANVMIDGDGQARITDFGLAGLAEAFEGAEIRVGTPAYMAPEQLKGKEVTVRSDIYALGLLLYELFTGRAAFEAATLAELNRQQLETMPPSPSTFVPQFEPAIERAVMRCLEKEPSERPSSALAVAAALPGGNALAVALEAGETPSPEMVANAGDADGLRPGTAVLCIVALLAGMATLMGLSSRVLLPNHFDMSRPPQALRVTAQELIAELGYEGRGADRLQRFGVDADYFNHVRNNDTSVDRWEDLAAVRPSPLQFLYRQSPRPLTALRQSGSADFSNPPALLAGMVHVALDTEGRLIDFRAVPPEREALDSEPTEPDWEPVLSAAGLDPQTLTPSTPEWNPTMDCDVRRAWEGTFEGRPDVPIRIEAGGFGGRVVRFNLIAPWTQPERTATDPTQSAANRIANLIQIALITVILVGGVFVARRNLNAGRGDRRGAFRMSSYVFVVILGTWALSAHHVAAVGEIGMIVWALQTALFASAICWVFYLALEPYVRRKWPQTLISWTRLFAGRFRDPLVGRDLLIGSMGGVGIALALALLQLAPVWVGRPGPSPISNSVAMLGSPKLLPATLLAVQTGAMLAPIGVFLLIFFLRLLFSPLTRRDWPAVGAVFVIMTVLQGLGQAQSTPLGWVLAAAIWGIIIALILRLGLLAGAFTFVYANLLLSLPLTTDLSDWYSGRALGGLLIASALAAYGFYLSLAGKKLIRVSMLDEH